MSYKIIIISLSIWIFNSIVFSQFVLVADLYPGLCNSGSVACGSEPSNLTVFGNNLIFSGIDLNNNNSFVLWTYDGINTPTPIPGSPIDYNQNLTVIQNNLYFSGFNMYGVEFWKYDGLSSPYLISDINISGDSWPFYFTEYKGNIFMRANSSIGSELYIFNISNETILAKDLNIGNPSSSPEGFVIFNDSLYFSANDGINGRELWMTDGVNEPQLKLDLSLGSSSSNCVPLIVYNNKLICQINTPINGTELWSFDGINTPELIYDINPGTNSSSPINVIVFNNELIFVADNGVNGRELFKYNGTDNPELIEDIYAGGNGSSIENLIVYNNKLFFNADDGVNGNEIWMYDGTSTSLFQDINIGIDQSVPKDFAIFDGKLFISAFDNVNGYELRVFDSELSIVEQNKCLTLLYPNPTKTVLQLQSEINLIGKKILIYDNMGKIISEQILNDTFINQIEVNFSKGIYFISIENCDCLNERMKFSID
jgi:ELWxxDGT repeat protein